MSKKYLWTGAFIPLSLFTPPSGQWPDSVSLRVGKGGCNQGPIFQASVVQTARDRNKGLGGRHNPLGPREGMIFVWDSKSDGGYFWMKDTFIPLSLLYFDRKGKLLAAHEMPVEPDPSQPQIYYYKPDHASVALEVASGYVKEFVPWDVYVLCVEKSSL